MTITQYYEIKKELKKTLRDAKAYKKLATHNELCGIDEYVDASIKCKNVANKKAYMDSIKYLINEKCISNAELYYTYAAEEYHYAVIDSRNLKQKPAITQKYIDAEVFCNTKAHEMKVLLAETLYTRVPEKTTK